MLGSMVLEMPPRTNDRQIRDRCLGWLKYHAYRNGWTQAQLARQMGTTEATISRIYSGGRSFGLDTLNLMRSKLHMDLCVVFDGEAPPVPKEWRAVRPLVSQTVDRPTSIV